MILWEIVAYLADDSRRVIAFKALRDRVDLTPPENPRRPPRSCSAKSPECGGSIAAEDRAARVCAPAARIVMEDFDGDLSASSWSSTSSATATTQEGKEAPDAVPDDPANPARKRSSCSPEPSVFWRSNRMACVSSTQLRNRRRPQKLTPATYESIPRSYRRTALPDPDTTPC